MHRKTPCHIRLGQERFEDKNLAVSTFGDFISRYEKIVSTLRGFLSREDTFLRSRGVSTERDADQTADEIMPELGELIEEGPLACEALKKAFGPLVYWTKMGDRPAFVRKLVSLAKRADAACKDLELRSGEAKQEFLNQKEKNRQPANMMVKVRHRGRPQDTDLAKDKKLFEAWASGKGQYRTKADLANAFRIAEREVSRALDRERHRQRSAGTPRKK